MRLIDAEALLRELKKLSSEPAYYHDAEDWYVGVACAEEVVCEQPSIEIDGMLHLLNSDEEILKEDLDSLM